MLYIKKTLLPEENILYYTKPHYIILFSFIFWLVFAYLNFEYFERIFNRFPMLDLGMINLTKIGTSLLMLGASANALLNSLMTFFYTEYAITNKRILVKKGFIQRDILEIFLNRIEGVHIKQSVIGRLLHFGTIIVAGIGGTKNPFRYIPNPLSFRATIQQQLQKEPNLNQT